MRASSAFGLVFSLALAACSLAATSERSSSSGNALAGGAAGVANSASGAVSSGLQYSLLSQLLNNQNSANVGAQANQYTSNINDLYSTTFNPYINSLGGG